MKIHRAKKYLGQNFLKSEAALRAIVGAGDIRPGDIILEIGPGRGALTQKILDTLESIQQGLPLLKGKVIGVEKDPDLVEFLQEKFQRETKEGKLLLIHDDILSFNVEQNIPERNYKIIANIPYNITGAILRKFLTAQRQPERMILMVQYEVAKRIMGANPTSPRLRGAKESVLSISVKAYGSPRLIMKVPKRYFSPAPRVDSAVIAICGISRRFFEENDLDEEKFWKIVKKGFAHKRKRLSSNFPPRADPPLAEKLASFPGLGDKRAEDLTLEDWLALAR